jgi:predicted RNase H-like HicB family nuclease
MLPQKSKVSRDTSGVFVGLVPGFPDVAAVGYTAEEAQRNLRAAIADLARNGRTPATDPPRDRQQVAVR